MGGKRELEQTVVDTRKEFYARQEQFEFDFSDVRGQENVKRALEVAAAGGHNLIMIDRREAENQCWPNDCPRSFHHSPYTNRWRRLKIHSVAGKIGVETSPDGATPLPFAASYHFKCSNGGEAVPIPQPGEVSLAHNGVLFLDELPEFNRSVLEVMRQPLEDRKITVSRARFSVDYPASFMLVASMNPCPCGYYNHPDRACLSLRGSAEIYEPCIQLLLDRIDIQVEIVPVPFEKISEQRPSEPSAAVRERVVNARAIQEKTFCRLRRCILQCTDDHATSA